MRNHYELDETRRARHLESLKARYPEVDRETLNRYLDYKEEGYTTHEARLMAGMSDPNE
jgi:hypothetical protein